MTTQKTTHLTLDKILARIGAAGLRLDHMNAVEAGAGNISVSVVPDPERLPAPASTALIWSRRSPAAPVRATHLSRRR